MKHVVSESQVAHLWVQDWAKNKIGNMSFREKKIYSYETCMGKIFEKPRKGKLVLLNSLTYSITTSRHQYIIACAVSHLPVLHIKCPPSEYLSREFFELEYNALILKIAKGRNGSLAQNSRIADLNQIIKTAAKYSTYFGKGWRKFKPLDAEILEKHKKAQAVRTAKEAEARKERDKKRELRKEKAIQAGLKWAELWLTGLNDREIADKTEDWDCDCWNYPNPLLRLKPADPQTVETSYGAEFPVAHVKKAWPLIKSIFDAAQEWRSNGKTIHLGAFKLDSIDSGGTIYAGCHHVLKSEVLRFAESIGLN